MVNQVTLGSKLTYKDRSGSSALQCCIETDGTVYFTLLCSDHTHPNLGSYNVAVHTSCNS